MTSNLSKFNMTITNLIDDLIIICGEKFSNLKMFKEQFNLLKKCNPRKIIEQFLINIQPYKEQIKERNDNFFLKKNYQEEVTKNVSEETNIEKSLDQILNLKEIWITLEEKNKEIIWDYFNVLVKLIEIEYNK